MKKFPHIFLSIFVFAQNCVFAESCLWDLPSFCKNWFENISVGGVINPIAYVSDHTPTTVATIPEELGSPGASDIAINYANLHAVGQFCNWGVGTLIFSYGQRSPSFVRDPPGGGDVFFVDQADIVIGNASYSPFSLQFGRHFIPFGGLDSSSYLESTTQLFTLSRETTFSIQYKNALGFSLSAYLFRGMSQRRDLEVDRTQANVYGFVFEYAHKNACVDYQLGISYLSNIVGTLYISSTLAHDSNLGNRNYFVRSVSGLDLHATVKRSSFDLFANYITALQRFDVHDLAFTTNDGDSFFGAQPAAWGVNLGYSFTLLHCYQSRLGVGYQGSSEAIALGTAAGSVASPEEGIYGPYFAIGIPKTRYYANYTVHICASADLAFEIANDQSYEHRNGGTGNQAVIALVSLFVKIGA